MDPYGLAIDLISQAREVDARWKSHTHHGSDGVLRASRDRLHSEHANLLRQLDETGRFVKEAEEEVAEYQGNLETATLERDASRREEAKLESRLQTMSLQLSSRDVVATHRTELEGVNARKNAIEARVRREAGDALNVARRGYRRGLSHARLVHGIPSSAISFLDFDCQIQEGMLIWKTEGQSDYEVIYPRPQ